jgi:hypothetical protein
MLSMQTFLVKLWTTNVKYIVQQNKKLHDMQKLYPIVSMFSYNTNYKRPIFKYSSL